MLPAAGSGGGSPPGTRGPGMLREPGRQSRQLSAGSRLLRDPEASVLVLQSCSDGAGEQQAWVWPRGKGSVCVQAFILGALPVFRGLSWPRREQGLESGNSPSRRDDFSAKRRPWLYGTALQHWTVK